MAKKDKSTFTKCLREARRDAGYQNIGQAGVATHRSPEVVGRHERGEVQIQPEDAIEYAEVYKQPSLMMQYCDQCAVRNELYGQQDARDDDLPLAAIRLSNRMRSAQGYADKLMMILDDGDIDASEAKDLAETISFLKALGMASRELYRKCLTDGIIKKSAALGGEQHSSVSLG